MPYHSIQESLTLYKMEMNTSLCSWLLTLYEIHQTENAIDKHFLLKRLKREVNNILVNLKNWFLKYLVTEGKQIPDLQLSSTTCWIRPPRKGTRTISKCSKFRAEARPVTKGTYFKEFVGPGQKKNKIQWIIQTALQTNFQVSSWNNL